MQTFRVKSPHPTVVQMEEPYFSVRIDTDKGEVELILQRQAIEHIASDAAYLSPKK